MNVSPHNTLAFESEICINCGRCQEVCPHGVFEMKGNRMQVVRPDACMECGACRNNCPVQAVQVDSGVGCATAMIIGALLGREPTCDIKGCCGGQT